VTSGHSWWGLPEFVVGLPRSRKSSETWGTQFDTPNLTPHIRESVKAFGDSWRVEKFGRGCL